MKALRGRLLEHSGWLLLGAVVAITLWAKLHLVAVGPELDPDAYAHAMAGRRMLEDASDVRVHWVWLPLWHAVHGLAARFGNGTFTVRALNAALTSVAPLLLAALLSRWTRSDERATGNHSDDAARRVVPQLAGAALALSPTCLELGSSSQMEPPVLLLLLGACYGWEALGRQTRGSWGWALLTGGLLATAALIRYEAWLMPPLFLLLWLRQGRGGPRALSWLLPSLAIVGWCVLHHAQTGEWLQFLRFNADFAEGYLAGVGYPWGAEASLPLMLVWYVVVVPFGELHVLLPFALGGAAWFVRRAPRSLVGVQLVLLLALTGGWMARQHLGLARHALTLAPLYATCLAVGVVQAARWLHARVGTQSTHWPPRRWLAAWAAAAALVLAAVRSVPSYLDTAQWQASAYQQHYQTALALRRTAQRSDWVYCDVPAVEVLSNLPPERFTRWPLRDVDPFHLETAPDAGGRALIVSDRTRTAHLRDSTRELYSTGALVLLAYRPADP